MIVASMPRRRRHVEIAPGHSRSARSALPSQLLDAPRHGYECSPYREEWHPDSGTQGNHCRSPLQLGTDEVADRDEYQKPAVAASISSPRWARRSRNNRTVNASRVRLE